MMTTCPTAAELNALLSEAVADADRTPLERHVETCANCQSWLESHIRSSLPLYRTVPDDVPPGAMARWLAPLASAPLKPGSTLGQYRIDGTLGSGGMGVVYRATDMTLDRPVALKVLSAALHPDSASRFVREVQSAARVRHDHIVQVFAAEAGPGGPAYLVMELVTGPTLRRAASESRGLDFRRAAEVVAQVADALAAVHTAGLIHRDVKPANVLLDATTGRAKLTDFGLARGEEGSPMTRSGMLVGTPAYMAPEQVRDPLTAGTPVDVYGLGATLYEALTGAEPFRGSLELILAQVLSDEPLPPRRLNPAVPRDLDTICLKAMAKHPAARYPSAGTMRDDLRRWLAGEPIQARPVGWAGRVVRWAARNPLVAGLVAALAVGGVASFAIVTWLWRASEDSAEAARQSASVAILERAKADQDYQAAEQVVNLFYQRLYDGGTVASPVNIETRLELIREAIAFYEQVAARRPGDKPPAELAAAHARKGMLHNMLKETEPAAASFRSALALFEQAERDGPLNEKSRREHAECLFYLGVSAGRSRDAKGAMAHYEAAITRLSPLADRDLQASYFLAGSLGNLAGVYEYLGDTEKARATYARALPVHRQARDANPKSGGANQDLIWTTLAVARLQPDAQTAVDQLLAARTLVQAYGRDFPTDYNRADVGGSYHTELALAFIRAGRTEEALEATANAVLMANTMAGYPVQFRRPSSQAAAWRAEGMARAAAGDQRGAVAAWAKAADLYESLDWNFLGVATFKHYLARIYDSLAADAVAGDATRADHFRQKAADTRERLKKEYPEFKPAG